ncbi:MAG: hypothetical protein K2R98_12225 [Gemmataceae bacterium]|nr:hypothetical protein [Gemmataceae bacterium]
MARQELDNAASYVAALVSFDTSNRPDGIKIVMEGRAGKGDTVIENTQVMQGVPSHWVRLKRQGNLFSSYCSADGTRWSALGVKMVPMSPCVHLGMAAASELPGGSGMVRLRHFAHQREQRWFYPGPSDCLSCHNSQSGFVLGVNARQLNRERMSPVTGMASNQLRTWNRLGLFAEPLAQEQLFKLERLVPVTGPRGSLENRVRSYLDVNCSHCHRPGVAEAFFDARFETPLGRQGIMDGPVKTNLGIDGARVVVPGEPGKSMLYQRIARCDAFKMPPSGRDLQDEAALRCVGEWITSLRDANTSCTGRSTVGDFGNHPAEREARRLGTGPQQGPPR